MSNIKHLRINTSAHKGHPHNFVQKLEVTVQHLAKHWEICSDEIYVTFLATAVKFAQERPLAFQEDARLTVYRNMHTGVVTYGAAFSGSLGDITSEQLTNIEVSCTLIY